MGKIAYLDGNAPPIASGGDMLSLMFEPAIDDAEWLAVPATRLDAKFFDLSSGLAGDIVQKCVNYKRRLAVVGDITQHVSASSALRDFVRESNRGNQVWFVNDRAELESRLASSSESAGS